MDYVNFSVAIPLGDYVRLENLMKKKNLTRNEIIIEAILGHLASNSADFDPSKTRFQKCVYNEIELKKLTK